MPADTAANGATKIPVTMPARTEILGAEDTARSPLSPPIAIESPIDPDAWKLAHPGRAS